jgi:hypothetical protein
MPIPTWSVGQVLAAADVNNWFLPLPAYKTANTSRTSATLTIDPDLQFTLAGGAVYSIQGGILCTAAAGIGFNFGWTIPASATGGYALTFNQSGVGTANLGLAWTATQVSGTPGGTLSLLVSGFIATGGGAGTFGLNWATNTGGSTSTCGTGSVLTAQRIG